MHHDDEACRKMTFPASKKSLREEATFNILTHILHDLLEETRRQCKKLKHSTQNIVEPTYNKNKNPIRNYSRTFEKHFIKVNEVIDLKNVHWKVNNMCYVNKLKKYSFGLDIESAITTLKLSLVSAHIKTLF